MRAKPRIPGLTENNMNTVCKPSDQLRTNARPVQSHRNHYDNQQEAIAHPLGEALKRLFLCGKADTK